MNTRHTSYNSPEISEEPSPLDPLPFGALSNFVAAAAQLAIVFQAEIRANCHPLRILKNIYEEF
jgi:hypothetical protein